MKSIFNHEHNGELLSRLEQITSETKPQWGKMNASQMILHCQKPLDVAEGTLPLPFSLMGKLFGKIFKRKFLKSCDLGRNAPTVKEFRIVETPEFNKEKAVLQSQIRRFGEIGPDVVANKTHPFFGTMNDDEWGQLQYIHLNHHFTQFGV